MKNLFATIKCWWHNDPFTQSAACAYYAIFSLPGLMILVMTLASFFFEQSEVEDAFLSVIRELMGANAAYDTKQIIEENQESAKGFWPTLIGTTTLIIGASGLFAQLQKGLNHIWGVRLKEKAGILQFLKRRLISIGLIFVIGFLLMVSLTLNSLIAFFSNWLELKFSVTTSLIIQIIHFTASFFLKILLFTFIFKILPDALVKWRYALIGGIISAALFTVGEYFLIEFLSIVKPQSSFGAAGSIVLMMVWMFYSCTILFFGAEYSKVAANAGGIQSVPNEIAEEINNHK